MSVVLVLVEHDRGALAEASLESLTLGRELAAQIGAKLHAATLGHSADGLAASVAGYGADVIHQAHHPILSDYGPDAWGATVAELAQHLGAGVVLATGTDRGNEVLAHVGARMDKPMVANCLEITPGDGVWEVVRTRWGGSLLERVSVDDSVKLLTVAHHSVDPVPAGGDGLVEAFSPTLHDALAVTVVRDREGLSQGITLATAPVVVAGGRGVDSAEGFAPLEELATLLGGAVGCSRVVTNNGWRPHSDQVGQTGTRIAPELYIACGISGAIQHWVGAVASKQILAINKDPEANMVRKANYAIIGDLHEVVPAIVEAVRVARRASAPQAQPSADHTVPSPPDRQMP